MASPEKQFQRAVAAFQEGKFLSARKLLSKLQKEVGAAPPVTHLNAFIELELGTPERAVAALQQAATLFPNDANVFNGLGIANRRCGLPDAALDAFTKALKLNPNQSVYHRNLGNLLSQMDRPVDAIRSYETALRLDPTSTESVLALVTDLVRLGQNNDAYNVLEQFARRSPDNVRVRIRLASLALAASNFGLAEEWYLAAQAIDANNEDAHGGIIDLLVRRGQIEQALSRAEALSDRRGLTSTQMSNYVHMLNYALDTTPADILHAAKRIKSRFKLSGPAPAVQDRNRQLRIGIVSQKLNDHPANFFTTPLLNECRSDKIAFEIFAANVPEHPATHRLRGLAEQWHDISDLSPEGRGQAIRNRNLDILISPTGHEEGDLLDLFRARLAPIQMTGFAAFCTTGVNAMDGFISDWHETPQGAEQDFSETVIRMPDGYICFLPPDALPELTEPVGTEIVFGSLNNISKICAQTLQLWQRVLAQQPNFRLLLKTSTLADKTCIHSITQRLIEAGIDPDRVTLEGPSPRIEALKTYRRIDVALDPLAYSGGVTTLEALWMGVPVITLPGATFARRHSLSHLTVAGLEQWVAASTDDYVAKALDAAERARKEKNFRQSIRDAMRRSPTSDAKAYARDFDHAVRNFSR